MIAPRVRARLDRDEAIHTIVICETSSSACEVRVQWRGVIVDRVDVPSGRVRLPDLDQSAAHRPPVGVDDPARDDDPLAERLARMLARQVGVVRPYRDAPECGPAGAMKPLVRKLDQFLLGRAPLGGAVLRIEVGRLVLEVVHSP